MKQWYGGASQFPSQNPMSMLRMKQNAKIQKYILQIYEDPQDRVVPHINQRFFFFFIRQESEIWWIDPKSLFDRFTHCPDAIDRS